jgi:hypothetical protein
MDGHGILCLLERVFALLLVLCLHGGGRAMNHEVRVHVVWPLASSAYHVRLFEWCVCAALNTTRDCACPTASSHQLPKSGEVPARCRMGGVEGGGAEQGRGPV